MGELTCYPTYGIVSMQPANEAFASAVSVLCGGARDMKTVNCWYICGGLVATLFLLVASLTDIAFAAYR